jgi:Ca2+-binding EF-hand superfamily protein
MRWKLTLTSLGLATLVGAGGFAAAGFADDGRDRGERHGGWDRMMLRSMDADEDGTVTRAEIDAAQSARTGEIDADKDGTITAEELVAYHEKLRVQRMADQLKAMDANGDGKVSVDEYEAAQTWRLARLDRDGDGEIEVDEMKHRGGMPHHR